MDIRVLHPSDLALLCAQPEGLFDNPVHPDMARIFLNDPNHVMIAGFDGSAMVSFASGAILRHPDKPASMFINEVGTRDSHQRQGYATAVSLALMDWGRARGITEFWLGTEIDNVPARALYRALKGDEGTFALFAWGFRWDDD